jgi:hypothetical protein
MKAGLGTKSQQNLKILLPKIASANLSGSCGE